MGIKGRLVGLSLKRHAKKLFAGAGDQEVGERIVVEPQAPDTSAVKKAAKLLARAKRPVLVVGSGALTDPTQATEVAAAVELLRMPVYLAGMARGLLGKDHPLQRRHRRTQALRESDLVILAGFPIDFRLDYGRKIHRKATLVAAGRDDELLTKNRTPDVISRGDAGRFLRRLAEAAQAARAETGSEKGGAWGDWLDTLGRRDEEREEEIAATAAEDAEPVNPLALLREIEAVLPDDSILVADGGDFVATASYILSPRGPLRWLDPGPFGTLGVGGGFALGAKLSRPDAEVWLLYGDGSAAYSLAEIDTFVRHGLPVIAVIGNDAGWTQIAREQVEILGDDVGVTLRRTAYHRVAEGYGGKGFEITDPSRVREVLEAARAACAEGHPVVINAQIGTTAFRKGSISM
jgi:acetolactate synthase-1/2/3 large subunit